jgi:hypothetical protein
VGSDWVWTAMLFAKDFCVVGSDFVNWKDNSQKVVDCVDKYVKIIKERSNDSEEMMKGVQTQSF